MTKISLELTLSAEDRKAIIDEVTTKLKCVADAAVKNAGKGGSAATTAAGTGKNGKNTPAAEPTTDEDFEDTDGAPDAEADAGGDDFEADATPAVTKADVQAALRDYANVSSKAEAMKLITTHGKADGLSNLKEANFAAVIKAAKAATAKAKKK